MAVYRTTDKGFPTFQPTDRFAVHSATFNDELVLVNPKLGYYRLKNEGAHILFVYDRRADQWEIRLPSGLSHQLGEDGNSRSNSARGTYRWDLSSTRDPFGHRAECAYVRDQGHLYLREIRYQLHAALAYQNTVRFEYADRPDVYTDYTYGDAETVGRRLASVAMLHGTRQVREYLFDYDDEALYSLLTRVQMFGEGASGDPSRLSMPALTLSYGESTPKPGAIQTMTNVPAVYGLVSGEATLEDVNGDALPDIVYGATLVGTAIRYYENWDGLRWLESRQMVGSPQVPLNAEGVLFADVDGDGFRDLLVPHDGGLQYYPGGQVRAGVLERLPGPFRLQSESDLLWTAPHVTLTDLDRNGTTDLLVDGPGELQSLLNKDGALRATRVPPLPSGTTILDADTELLDFNGDRYLDLVRHRFAADSSAMDVSFGRGEGRFTSPHAIAGVPTGAPEEFYLQDVNYDGQTDVLRISGDSIYYYLANGLDRFGSAHGPFRGISTSNTQHVLFADMNGNGTRDIVWVTHDSGLQYLDLRLASTPGLLTRIDNGMGMVAQMTYKTSTDYLIEDKWNGEPWTSPLPHPVPVLSETVVSDSLQRLGLPEQQVRTTFKYSNGYFDGREREFRGFALVRSTQHGDVNHPTRVTEHFIHVGRNLLTGEDEEILKGKSYAVLQRDLSGRLYHSAETVWDRKWLCDGDVASVVQIAPECRVHLGTRDAKDHLLEVAWAREQLEGFWEGTADPRWVYQRATVDEWGRAKRVEHYGEVGVESRVPNEPFDARTFDLALGNDERFSDLTYADNIASWILGRPATTRSLSAMGAVLGQDRSYYDGESFIGLPLGEVSRGMVTRRTAWLKDHSGSERWIESQRLQHDTHGNVIATKNPLGFVHEIEYDADTAEFPTTEHLLVGSHVPGGRLSQSQRVDRALGVIVHATNFNGHEARFEYDGLARLIASYGPSAAPIRPDALPELRVSYEYGDPVSVTTAWNLRERDSGTYQRSLQFTDGLGRVRLTRGDAELPYGTLNSGWMTYSARGGVVEEHEPYPGPEQGFYAPPAGTPNTRQVFDVMGRMVRSYWPGENTYQESQYLPLERRGYDEQNTSEQRLYPQVVHFNGQQEAVAREVYNQVDGRLDVMRWNAEYDALGRVTALYDPEGNPRIFEYDSLGRLLRRLDPNAGETWFRYNDLGAVTRQENALGEAIRTGYHPSGRPLTIEYVDVRGNIQSSSCYHYDVPVLGVEARNLLGKVSAITSAVNTYQLSYDTFDRTVDEWNAIWNPHRSGLDDPQYDIFHKHFDYDVVGNLKRWVFPNGVTGTADYNARNLLRAMHLESDGSAGSLTENVSYDVLGKTIRAELGNGLSECTLYDGRQRMAESRLGADCRSDMVRHFQFGYTANNQLARILDLGAHGGIRFARDFTYDPALQLQSARVGELQLGYRYDRIQNLVQRSASAAAGLPDPFRYEEIRPNLLLRAGTHRLVHDAAGRLRSAFGNVFHYDAGDRLVRIAAPTGERIDYYYAMGPQRVVAIRTDEAGVRSVERQAFEDYWLHDDRVTVTASRSGTVIAELTEDTVLPTLRLVDEHVRADLAGALRPSVGISAVAHLTDLARGEAVARADPRLRFHHPSIGGTPSHVTESDGTVSYMESRYPFGALATRFGDAPIAGFTGSLGRLQGLQTVHLGMRVYLPQLARWLTPDPAFSNSPASAFARPLEANLYSYVGNNPVNFVDPTGLAGDDAIDEPFQREFTGTDVMQGSLNSCVVAASGISMAHRNPEALRRLIVADGSKYRVMFPNRMQYVYPSELDGENLSLELNSKYPAILEVAIGKELARGKPGSHWEAAYGDGTTIGQALGTMTGRTPRVYAMPAARQHGGPKSLFLLSTLRRELMAAEANRSIAVVLTPARDQVTDAMRTRYRELGLGDVSAWHTLAVVRFDPFTDTLTLQDPGRHHAGEPKDFIEVSLKDAVDLFTEFGFEGGDQGGTDRPY
jgi:RHS repeat-associated protein